VQDKPCDPIARAGSEPHVFNVMRASSNRRFAWPMAVLAAVALVGPASAEQPPADGGAPNPTVCVKWTTEVRYRPYGYDHLVHITNGCDKPARCRVKTNVNPEPSQVRVLPKETASVVTFQGSPAREFTADVRCVLER
jgi:hypothetical protein